ncbi:MAG: hypothetical protein WCA46_00305 [Actinocatenispora sp.]
MTHDPCRPHGRPPTAKQTPFRRNGFRDADDGRRPAGQLVDARGNDGLVGNGAIGEAPTATAVRLPPVDAHDAGIARVRAGCAEAGTAR